MGLFLDCENQEIATKTLGSLFGCSGGDLVSLLNSIDLKSVYQDINNSPDFPHDEYIYRKTTEAFGIHKSPDYICWFHLTRTFPGNTFDKGILPLGDALVLIWEHLLKIFKGTEHHSHLHKLKENGIENDHYQLKEPNPFHWGPSAMLVRDVAFRAREIGNHDYLRIPEIVEDICNGYYDKYGLNIYDEVFKSLKPCIVKFKSNFRIDEGCVKSALYYIYASIKGDGLSSCTCFDAQAKKIPPEDILKIEFLDHYDAIFQPRAGG